MDNNNLLLNYYVHTRGLNADVIQVHIDKGLLRYSTGMNLFTSKKRTPTGKWVGVKCKPCGLQQTRGLTGAVGLSTYRFFENYTYMGPTDLTEQSIKTMTASGRRSGLKQQYYYNMIYFSQPLYIAEGDIDYFSVYNINPNTIGMVGNNIEKLCDDLQSYGYSEKVYLLMDCDSPSNKKIHDLKQKLRQKKYSFIIIDSRHVMNQA